MSFRKIISLTTAFSILSTTVFAGISIKNETGIIQDSVVSYTAEFMNNSGKAQSPLSAIAWYENGALRDFEIVYPENGEIVDGDEASTSVSLNGNPQTSSRVLGFSLNGKDSFEPLSLKEIHNSGNPENKIVELNIDDADGSEAFIDEDNKVISIYIPLYDKNDGTEYFIDNLKTTLTLSENASARINGTGIMFEEDGDLKSAQVDYTKSPMFEVVAENGDVCVYHTKIYRKIDADFEDSLVNGAMFQDGKVIYAKYDYESGTVVPDEDIIPENGVGKYLYFKSGAGSPAYQSYQQYSKAYKKEVIDRNGETSNAMYIEKTVRGEAAVDTYSLRLHFGNIQSLDKFPKELSLSYDIKYENVNGDYANDPTVSGLDVYGTKLLYRVSASSSSSNFAESNIVVNGKKAASTDITQWNNVNVNFSVDDESVIHSNAYINETFLSAATDTNAGLPLTMDQKPEFSLGLSARRCLGLYIDNLKLSYLISDNTDEEAMSSEESITPVENELTFNPVISREGKITLNGTGNTGYVFASVFKYDSEKDIASQIFDKDAVIAIDAAQTDAEGNFDFEWILSEDAESAEYAFVVGNTNSKSKMTKMYYASSDEYQNALEEVSNADEKTICNILEKNAKVLQLENILNNESYKNSKNMMAEIMITEKPSSYESDDEIRTDVLTALDACMFIKSVKSSLSGNISKYAEILQLDVQAYEDYSQGVDNCFESVSEEYCRNNMLNLNSAKRILDISISLAKVNEAPKSKVIDVIANNASDFEGISELGIDSFKYKDSLAKKIYVFDKPYSTVEELVVAVKNGMESAGDDEDDSESNDKSPVKRPSLDGRGGNKGGSVVTVTPSLPPVEKEETTANQESAMIFNDVDASHWAKAYIESLFRIGVVNGKGDGSFCPDDTVKREEFIKMLVCSLDIPLGKAGEQWYSQYLEAAINEELVFGYGNGSYGIGENITREDAAVILVRAIADETDLTKVKSSFNDSDDISDYATESVAYLNSKGIILGNDKGEFLPKGNLTRAECSKMIYCIIDILG